MVFKTFNNRLTAGRGHKNMASIFKTAIHRNQPYENSIFNAFVIISRGYFVCIFTQADTFVLPCLCFVVPLHKLPVL